MRPLLFGAAAMLVVGAIAFFVMTAGTPQEPAGPRLADTPAADTVPVPEKPDPSAGRSEPASPPPAAPRAPAPPPKPVTAMLVVSTDVPGASVFVDRKFVGTTPLQLADLPPGTKQLKLTAEGYEGIDRTVDLEPGKNAVNVRFREVRLNERIAVEHKHGIGGCEGTLVATVDGLSYRTSHENDAFTLTFAQLETFEVNYLEKNLRVKQRGGRTWNFTGRAGADADALFVFHREVEAARKKLADGFTPVR